MDNTEWPSKWCTSITMPPHSKAQSWRTRGKDQVRKALNRDHPVDLQYAIADYAHEISIHRAPQFCINPADIMPTTSTTKRVHRNVSWV